MNNLEKLLIIAIILFLLNLPLAGCNLSNNNLEEVVEPIERLPFNKTEGLPEWLLYSHRSSGFLAPEVDETQANAVEDEAVAEQEEESSNDIENSNNAVDEPVSPPAQNTVSRPRPSGSPYEPGSLKDLIWHQRQADRW